MLPNTVSIRLRHLYDFPRYLVDRELAYPDLLKRELWSSAGDAAQGHGPEDVQELLASPKSLNIPFNQLFKAPASAYRNLIELSVQGPEGTPGQDNRSQ